MNFAVFSEYLERIEGTTKRLEITAMLGEMFNALAPDEIDKVCYLLLGKIYPDFVGIELGIADALIQRALSIASGLKIEIVSEVLKNEGDIGTCAENVIRQKKQTALFSEPLTIERVYGNLCKIAESTGSGSQDYKLKLIAEMFHDAQPLEARYIARILAGSLRLGIAESTILDALAIVFLKDMEKNVARELLEDKYNLCSDIGLIAKSVKAQGMKGIENIGLKIGVPIRAMLASRAASMEELFDRMGKFAGEYKYDGLRIQAHISNSDIKLYSRRLENLTEQFPDVIRNLRSAFRGREGIFEGECVPIDPDTDEMLPFQEVSKRRGRKYGIEETMKQIPVCLFLFDCLYLDGREYLKNSYLERRKALETAFVETEHVKFSHMKIIEDMAECEQFFNEAISAGCEGIMAKNTGPEGVYKPGKRGFLWLKYKREYKSELADTLDLVVLGAFAGKGRRAGTYGALLTGVYNPEKDTYETICKLGTGFDDATLSQMPQKFATLTVKSRPKNVISKMEPDFWFVPMGVVEVQGAELTISPVHTCGYGIMKEGAGIAVRFPRFTGRWRDDKAPTDATTTGEIIEMYKKQLKRIEERDLPE
jgi:DNA ligase-1